MLTVQKKEITEAFATFASIFSMAKEMRFTADTSSATSAGSTTCCRRFLKATRSALLQLALKLAVP
jgi:hypothetical protein